MDRKNSRDLGFRYDEYLTILAENPAYRQAFDSTCGEYLRINGSQMQLDSRLYLMVFAPALADFVSRVMEQAVITGKNRLYFLSRDGYQMYLIACRLAAYGNIPIECKYLHVSRYSMRIPGYHLNLERCIDSICVGGIDVTLLKILRRGALTEDECRNVIRELNLEEIQDRVLNYHQVLLLKERLAASSRLIQYIRQHSVEAYDNAIGYLKQEGLCQDGHFAIVDSGWIGTLQCSIETLIQSVNPNIKVEGYYFGMYEYPGKAGREQFHTYYFSPERGLSRKVCFSNSLFETIVSADEGMTVAYGVEDGQYFPIQKERGNLNARQIRRNIAALELYLKYLEIENKSCDKEVGQGAERCDFVSRNSGSKEGVRKLVAGKSVRQENAGRELTEKLLKKFMSGPTALEYGCYGKDLFSDDVFDESQKEVAAGLTRQQIRDQRLLSKLLIMSGFKKAVICESAWPEGSAFRALGEGRRLSSELRHIRLYKGFVYVRKACAAVSGMTGSVKKRKDGKTWR